MFRACCFCLFLIGSLVLPACSGDNKPPAPLSPDEEKQMEKQLETDRQAEGAAEQNF